MERTRKELAIEIAGYSRDYNNMQEELAEITKRKAVKIKKSFIIYKSEEKAELIYKASEDGQREIEIEILCKGLLELKDGLKIELKEKGDL